LPPLSPAQARQVDKTCDRFEAAWKAGQRPQPEAYLGAADEPMRSTLLRQLLFLDWDYRRRAGEGPSAADYHARFPGDAALIEAVAREMTEVAEWTPVASGASGAQPETWPEVGAPSLRDETVADVATNSTRYHLSQEIGRGGIGVVFRGRDRHLGRELAVK